MDGMVPRADVAELEDRAARLTRENAGLLQARRVFLVLSSLSSLLIVLSRLSFLIVLSRLSLWSGSSPGSRAARLGNGGWAGVGARRAG